MVTMLNQMAVRPLSDALGAEVSGINVSNMDDIIFI